MMFRDADASIAGLVAQPGVGTNLIEHALIEDGIFPGHALLQFPAPANSHVHEGVKLHGILLVGTHARRKGMQLSLEWAVKCIVSGAGMTGLACSCSHLAYAHFR